MQDPYPTDPSPAVLKSTDEYHDRDTIPQQIGRYRVQRVLGKGGFGLVYLAHDDQLQRPVAIKVAHARLISQPSDAKAYLTEARTVANLDHPNIVPVYDVGGTEQFPVFVVSKYIDGTDLFTRLRQSRLPLNEAVELVATVAEALHYAHKQEIVHRDIKPNNILLDKTGKPFVADFGLALREQDVGKGPRYAGTPAYMSPEQARGEGHRVDGRSDIFSLGVVFYELLTGKRPFKGNSTEELFEAVTTFEPRPPRQLDDHVPKELERICLKALAKRASERFSTAKDLADDLRYWRNNLDGGRSAVKPQAKPAVEPELVAVLGLTKAAFISYATPDKDAAFRLCILLEEQGIGCWIAPRDVAPGADYGEAIIRAIETTATTVLMLSAHANVSIHVKHEVERATSKGKRVIPLRLEDVLPGPSLELHLATAHRLDAFRVPHEQVAKQLASVLRGEGVTTPSFPPTTPHIAPSSDSQPVKIVPKGLRSFNAHDADFFLELLPGPRDREGLPDSIRFWKNRIEEADADNTFSVGLIYGPSGCGKSSLVKAGLLPRLAPSITAAYIEATGEETEARLLKAVRRQVPDLPETLGLVESLAALRQGQFLAPRQKVLLVLDQFEQWLHAKHHEENSELVQALRQCDGGRLQAAVMVRDDFGMAATRFMAALDIPLLQGNNFATVDLFDPLHARKVLAAFGRAYGRLPDNVGQCSKDQNAFLDQAVAGLAQQGKVVSVRLALFAEMVKGKPWSPATLKEVGGTEGVGVTFLEETFTASTTPPQHRLHQKAAQAVLKALLPEAGTDIKGHMRSQQELLQASGYADRRKDFDDVIRILDSELRLITPTDPEGKDEPDTSNLQPGAKYYQLTHDYLVPSLRDWLTRKQKETRRGRAELLLAERATAYSAKPDSRHLPGWLEWPRILLFTRRRNWTPTERRVMRTAGRRRGAQAVLTLVLLLAAVFAGREARRRVNEDYNRVQADAEVKRLLVAPLAATPGIAVELASYRAWTDPELRRVLTADSGSHSAERLRASIGLLDVDPAQAPAIYDAMLQASPDEARVLIGVLKPHRSGLIDRLRRQLGDSKASVESRLRAAMALAEYAPPAAGDAFWLSRAAALVDQMLAEARQDPGRYEPLVAALEPAKKVLLPALEVVFRDARRSPTERDLATSMLAKYAADDAKLLVTLIEDAQPDQFLKLFPLLGPHREAARGPLTNTVNEAPAAELPQAERVTLGRRRASAALALLRQGEIDAALNALRVSDDPESLTQIVHGARTREVSPGELLACLDRTDKARQTMSGEARTLENRVLFGVLLALGDFTLDDLPQDQRDALLARIAEWHARDASSAIHGATGWLLRHWGRGEVARQVDETPVAYSLDREWFTLKIELQQRAVLGAQLNGKSEGGRERVTVQPVPDSPAAAAGMLNGDELVAIDSQRIDSAEQAAALIGRHVPGDKVSVVVLRDAQEKTLEVTLGQNATLTPFYITFVVFPPGKYLLGSPDGESDRQTDERHHQVDLTRPFAVSDREVTWAQYNPFQGVGRHDFMEEQVGRKLALDEPAFGPNWFDAASYCRWLTSQAGLAESEQCYADPDSLEKDAEGNPKNWPLDVTKHGFRLPTEAEWEVACRGGTMAAWSFGNDVQLLKHYAWFVENSAKWSDAVGQLRPNPRGLFDVHGNLYEWCHDWYGSSFTDDAVDPVGAPTGALRVDRGGSWNDDAALCRSAIRGFNQPSLRFNFLGFRLALVPLSSSK